MLIEPWRSNTPWRIIPPGKKERTLKKIKKKTHEEWV
jgi:hypothetical protein